MKDTKTEINREEIKIPVRRRVESFAAPVKYKILKDEEINLTKAKAFEFLEAKSFSGERQVREHHVQHLYDEWMGGRFMWHHVILALAVLGDEVYRMNGQHTCWMRVNIPEKEDPKHCPVRAITYRVDDSESLRSLYSSFDRNAPRTSGHISQVMLMDTPAGIALPPSYIKNLAAGFKVFFSPSYKNQDRALPIDELVGLIKANYPELFNMVGRFFQIHQQEARWSKRSAVLAAQFATFEKNVHQSDIFWSAVLSGIGLEAKTDARWHLREWLNSHAQSIIPGGKKTNTEETFRICIQCWNRWRIGDKVEMLRPTEERVKVRS